MGEGAWEGGLARGGGNYEEKSAGVNLHFCFSKWLLSHNEFSVSIERMSLEGCS